MILRLRSGMFCGTSLLQWIKKTDGIDIALALALALALASPIRPEGCQKNTIDHNILKHLILSCLYQRTISSAWLLNLQQVREVIAECCK